MLTRLKVNGFKNLVNIDVKFGPFTCLAGPNGVGKSNIFDAILFLRELADKPFVEAADSIRGGDPRLLFTSGYKTMRFHAEMLIPPHGYDEFGQDAHASSTFVEYQVELCLDDSENGRTGPIRLSFEQLKYIKKREARSRLGFPHSTKWRDSVVKQFRRGTYFISTDSESGKVKRHQDQAPSEGKQSQAGRQLEYNIKALPRTVLSSARNAQETRTSVLVRREMQGWRLLQLEPASMRQPDDIRAPDQIDYDGSHLPAALYRLTYNFDEYVDVPESLKEDMSKEQSTRILSEISNRLSSLVPGIEWLTVTRDDERKLYRIYLKERDGTELPAASLSDGTLRFLALAVIEMDPTVSGVICLEEPENGVHPYRMGAMLQLLQDIALDVYEMVGSDNPMRQVIVNTHSPVVVGLVPSDTLLFASSKSIVHGYGQERGLALRCIEGTWRTGGEEPMEQISLGEVLAYLNAGRPKPPYDDMNYNKEAVRTVRQYAEARSKQLNLDF